ncbi:DUF6607 family protein [Henriciella sp.]|uniref:DUF6607 family protein n=1 Tax=Henriciella sp. TaxID=1968823 RepID=UPI00261527A7|nr:DUF6607 family protein [Henriciella sp.]
MLTARINAATLAATAAIALMTACTATSASSAGTKLRAPASAVSAEMDSQFEQDRQAILAMAGDYKVTFDFTETVPLLKGYELKEPKLSGAHEVVRVIEDRGDFISLQHILVVGGDEKFPVKHWRQDWQYEPEEVMVFIGGNAWEMRDVAPDESDGAWSQTVYQVDDSPRYGAVGDWSYDNGVAEWTPPHEWRPLPRRDMTTRDDYHAVDAMNRHVITPFGWVHEQDNSKLILTGEAPQALVHEIGVNTYKASSDFDVGIATDYWDATKTFWAAVREEWNTIATENDHFAITIKGETGDLYGPLLDLANEVRDGTKPLETASEEARALIQEYVTPEIGELATRLRPTTTLASAN